MKKNSTLMARKTGIGADWLIANSPYATPLLHSSLAQKSIGLYPLKGEPRPAHCVWTPFRGQGSNDRKFFFLCILGVLVT